MCTLQSTTTCPSTLRKLMSRQVESGSTICHVHETAPTTVCPSCGEDATRVTHVTLTRGSKRQNRGLLETFRVHPLITVLMTITVTGKYRPTTAII